MANPHCSSISSMVEKNWFVEAENGACKNNPSNMTLSFLPYFQIRTCEVRCKSVNIFSRQHGNTATCLLHSSLIKVVSTLVIFWRRRCGYRMCGLICAGMM